MNIAPFEQIKLTIQELLKAKEYADDSFVEGVYNRTEILIKRTQDPELKDTFLRMFNEVKIRNSPYSNNYKLTGLETMLDTLISSLKTGNIVGDIEASFGPEKKSRIIPILTPVVKWAVGFLTALLVTYLAFRFGWM